MQLTDKDRSILTQVAFKAAVDITNGSPATNGTFREELEINFGTLRDFLFTQHDIDGSSASLVAQAFPGAVDVSRDADVVPFPVPHGDGSYPEPVPGRAPAPAPVPGAGQINAYSTDDELWSDVLSNRENWWDNRNDKKNSAAPDFKHKTLQGKPGKNGKTYNLGLWLKDAPQWVRERLG